MAKRGRKPGTPKTGGRQKGTPNRKTKELQHRVEASGLTPLDYMLAVMRNPRLPVAMRFDAARSAAPYIHPRLSAIEHTGKDGGPIITERVSDIEAGRRMLFLLNQAAEATSKAIQR